jgi:hypothetical protein
MVHFTLGRSGERSELESITGSWERGVVVSVTYTYLRRLCLFWLPQHSTRARAHRTIVLDSVLVLEGLRLIKDSEIVTRNQPSQFFRGFQLKVTISYRISAPSQNRAQ